MEALILSDFSWAGGCVGRAGAACLWLRLCRFAHAVSSVASEGPVLPGSLREAYRRATAAGIRAARTRPGRPVASALVSRSTNQQ